MASTFEIEGLSEIMSKIEKMGKEGVKLENDSLKKSAEPILDDAKATTAFIDRTGKLRKSLKISNVKMSKEGKFVYVGDTDKIANYSWYVEYKHPFLRPAFEKNKKEVLARLKQEIAKGLAKSD
jgi:HK97 gp10 family phage protein